MHMDTCRGEENSLRNTICGLMKGEIDIRRCQEQVGSGSAEAYQGEKFMEGEWRCSGSPQGIHHMKIFPFELRLARGLSLATA